MMNELSSSEQLISVVIPTCNRWELLDRCLTALEAQLAPSDSYEIIVVDDGSRDATPRIVARHCTERTPRLRYIRSPKSSPAAARNRGIRKAQGELIAFTDDDCVPDADWLLSIRRAFLEHPESAGIGGITYSEPEKITPFTHQVEDALPYSFPTCNVAYKKAILEAVAGFDEEYRFPYNEDWDLVFAVQQHGPIRFEPGMLVCHPPRPDSFKNKVLRMKYPATEFQLRSKYPEQYRRSVHRHPWRVILYHQGIVQFMLQLKRHRKLALTRPLLFLKLLALLLTQRIYLLLLLPTFISIDRRYRKQGRN